MARSTPVTISSERFQDAADPGVVALDPRRILDVLRRRIWLVLLVVALVNVPIAYLVYRSPLHYRANAVIGIVDSRQALVGGLTNAEPGSGVRPVTDPILSKLQVLLSRSMAGQAVDDPDAWSLRIKPSGFSSDVLGDVRIAPTAPLDTLAFQFGERGLAVSSSTSHQKQRVTYGTPVDFGGVQFMIPRAPMAKTGTVVVIPRGAAIDSLLRSLEAQPRRTTNVIDVAYTARDPRDAQHIVNTVVRVYQAANARAAQQQSRRRRIFLEEQLRHNDSILGKAQVALSTFRRQQRTYSARDRFAFEQQGLMSLEVERDRLVSELGTYRLLLGQLKQPRDAQGGDGLRMLVLAPGISTNPVVSQLYTQLVRYEAARDSLTLGEWKSSATDPDVQRLNMLVSSTTDHLVGAVQSYTAMLDARIKALDTRRAANGSAFDQLPEMELEETRLSQRLDALRKVADQLREEYQRARIEEAVEPGQVEIIDLATLPTAPVGLGRSMKLLMGVLFGLFLGGSGAILMDRMNTSIRHSDDIESALQIPGLAVIPQVAMRSRRHALAANGKRSDGPLAEPLEAFRVLRTNLIFSQAIRTLRCIAITSPAPRDGKTTTATNLAATFAQQGMRVLLVDADLRRPWLHTIFQVPRTPGLTQLLQEASAPSEVIRDTPVSNLFVLTGGAPVSNPAELLGGTKTREIIQTLSQDFDVVIIDCPPVLAAADAAILATIADGVLFVLRAGQTERDSAVDALRQLYTVGARVVGAVLNDPDAEMPRYRSYTSYAYGSSAD
jgi:capsular exopolysaccharide synthesis family protein